MASSGNSASHTIQPVEITVHQSKAFAQSVGTICVRFEKDGADYDLVSTCRFLSRLQLVEIVPGSPSCWRMLSIEMIYLQDSIIPVTPPAFLADVSTAQCMATKRKSYRLLSWALTRKGLTIRDDLPGSDDMASVQAVVGNNQKWLSGSSET